MHGQVSVISPERIQPLATAEFAFTVAGMQQGPNWTEMHSILALTRALDVNASTAVSDETAPVVSGPPTISVFELSPRTGIAYVEIFHVSEPCTVMMI